MAGLFHDRDSLLARLQEGPLPAAEWPTVAASLGSLKARICYLRREGFKIESRAHPPVPGQRGRPRVSYVLVQHKAPA